MKYDLKAFNKAVVYYRGKLRKIQEKDLMVILDHDNHSAFLSIAPFSRAASELGKDIYVIDKDSNSLKILLDAYDLYEEGNRALDDFIREANKKIKNFHRIFKMPLIIETQKRGFSFKKIKLDYKGGWFREYRKKSLLQTCRLIWKEVYNLKPKEVVSIGFQPIPRKEEMGLPLEDYFDSYAIILAMMGSCKNKKSVGASSSRVSQIERLGKVAELNATLSGCELSKSIDEPVFIKFRKLSKVIRGSRLRFPDASFFIVGKGYSGRHIFGEKIGYPTPNRKTRWNTPGGIIYQFDWFPQTAMDRRAPKARVGFTETLPIDVFIETNFVDWKGMRQRSSRIKRILDACNVVRVSGKYMGNYRTDLRVFLKGKKHRWVRIDDGSSRHKINHEYFRMTGVKAGTMSNIPAGESFVTPEYMEGVFVGDVIISLDQSYLIDPKKPMIVKTNKKGYRVVSGPKDLLQKLKKKKIEAKKLILEQEKNRSLPKKLIDLKKKNFNKIGEFAVNTNPKAKLCRYLIVNEKIANMIHIALGSGFEPDRITEYHTDIVIDAQKQELDIYGVRGKEKIWILKKGKFVI